MTLLQGVAEGVCQAAQQGALGSVTPGAMYLLRQEDRIFWVQVFHLLPHLYLTFRKVVEAGNGYHVVSVKGLELQETSCHSLEATRSLDRRPANGLT